MNGKVDMNVVGKGIETVSNLSKLAVNLSNGKQQSQEKKVYKDGDNTNQPHNQTVEVKVGSEQNQKPVIVHEKKETHVHKPYPDSRNLTEEECKVETLRIQAAHEEAMAEIEYRRWLEDENRKERREREEQLRKERERKAEENKKSNKKFAIFAGAFCAGLLGLTAYGIYTDSRRPSTRRLAFLPTQNVTTPISTEGSVE